MRYYGENEDDAWYGQYSEYDGKNGDADGRNGRRRKRQSQSRCFSGFYEKEYFEEGNSGYKIFSADGVKFAVLICYDQWFPEAARAMALQGAECILYPTAIGSEPQEPTWDSSRHWQRVMQGHAAANLMPVMAANRIGREVQNKIEINFYGSSFIADNTGALVAEAGRDTEEVIHASFDRSALSTLRSSWGLFRDRRPELYGALLTLDGSESYFSHPSK